MLKKAFQLLHRKAARRSWARPLNAGPAKCRRIESRLFPTLQFAAFSTREDNRHGAGASEKEKSAELFRFQNICSSAAITFDPGQSRTRRADDAFRQRISMPGLPMDPEPNRPWSIIFSAARQ